jgi:small GTP-binding protein
MSWRVPNQPRVQGQEQARAVFFGEDPELQLGPQDFRARALSSADDAERALEDALIQIEGLVPPARYGESYMAVKSVLRAALSRVSQAGEQLRDRDVGRPFRVVLMGRTMAGKSTLFEYLSGGDGARTGDGRQRFSRDVSARIAAGLGAEIVDTPGVGAMDGQDDYDIAFGQVADADLVLWVATNQAVQEQTGQALERLSDLGKPILVALNCMRDVRDELGLLDMLEAPDLVFGGDAEGNLAPIRRHLAKAGGQYIDAVPIHALAAQLARSGQLSDDDSQTLHNNSRIDTLIAAIRDQKDRTATLRRIVGVSDFLRVELLDVASQLNDAGVSTAATLRASRGFQRDFRTRAIRRIEDAYEDIKAAFMTAAAARARWIEQVDVDQGVKKINEQWDQELRELRAELERYASDVAEHLETDLRGIAFDVAADWSQVDTDDLKGLGGRGAIWGNRAVKAGGRAALRVGVAAAGAWAGAALGAIAGTVIPGIGNIIGLVIGGLVGLIGGGLGINRAIDWVGDRIFSSAMALHEQRRLRVRDQLSPLLEQLREKLDLAAEEVRRDWLRAVDVELARETEGNDVLESALEVLRRASSERIEPAIGYVDTELARELLRILGRHRAASSIARATRWRGAGIAVDFPEPAFSELVLFPVDDSVERILPTRVGATSAVSALQIIRSLADHPMTVHAMRPNEVVIDVDSELAPGVREAWQDLAHAHTGVQVSLTACAEGVAK